MTTPLLRLAKAAQRHRQANVASAIPYATMHLEQSDMDDDNDRIALCLPLRYRPDGNNTGDQEIDVKWDNFGLQWRDNDHSLVRIGTQEEPLDADIIEAARHHGVLVFFMDDVHLAPDHFAVFHAAQAI